MGRFGWRWHAICPSSDNNSITAGRLYKMNNAQLKVRLMDDIHKAMPQIDINKRISFDKYNTKNQIRVYKSFFSYVFEFLGIRESEYVFFQSKIYLEILYKVAEVLIISESIKESKGKDSSFLKEREIFYSTRFDKEIYKRFCEEHNLSL